MEKQVYISVSTDPIAEPQGIIDYAKKMQKHADFLHCDIMDGEFVEKKTYSAALVKKINANTILPLDVHLMCREPLGVIQGYLDAGANIITIHYEAFKDKRDLMRAISLIKEGGALAGISFKPATKVKDVRLYLHDIDLVLVMSVEPGESGQSFMVDSLDKIAELDRLRRENGYSFKIEVDGGINGDNAASILAAGADMLVSGSYVYNAPDCKVAIQSLKKF